MSSKFLNIKIFKKHLHDMELGKKISKSIDKGAKVCQEAASDLTENIQSTEIGKKVSHSVDKGAKVCQKAASDLTENIQRTEVGKNISKSIDKGTRAYREINRDMQLKEAKKYNSISIKDDIIFNRLEMATDTEVREMCKYLSLNYYEKIPLSYICKIYRESAGHTMANVVRSDQALPYKRILIDVADKMKPGITWTEFSLSDQFTEIEIEEKIFEYFAIELDKHFQGLSAENKKELEDKLREQMEKEGVREATIKATIITLSSGGIGAALAGSLATAFFAGSTVTSSLAYISGLLVEFVYTAYAVPTAAQVALCGTGVGAAIGIPLLVATLGGPAYRKTIPATLKMIAIRKRYESELAANKS